MALEWEVKAVLIEPEEKEHMESEEKVHMESEEKVLMDTDVDEP